jgi:hypothetical protein
MTPAMLLRDARHNRGSRLKCSQFTREDPRGVAELDDLS